MAVDGVSYSGPKNYSGNFYQSLGKSTQTEAIKQAQAAKAKYFDLANQTKKSANDAILSATFGTTIKASPTFTAPSAPAVQAPPKRYEAPSSTVPKAQTSTVATGNKVTNTQSTAVTVSGGTGNIVQGATGWSSRNNTVAVEGKNNTINIAGKNLNGASEATFAATGGAGIRENKVAATGNNNSVTFSGQNINQNTVNLNGNGNSVDIAGGVNKANVNVTGNNVAVTMKSNNPLTKGQDNWKVSVGASDINVTIENGKATVSGAGATAKGVKVNVNNETREVTVTKE